MTILGKGQAANNQLYWVADNIIADDFPAVSSALRDPDGLLAIGGDLGPDRLLGAYRRGIFPWYSEGQPILWWSPDPRCVMEPADVRVSRSLAKTIRKGLYSITYNCAFAEVVRECAAPRDSNSGTWITDAMFQAYLTLHAEGRAVSVESWYEGELAGGLYGVVLGKVFFGESMFSRKTDASKVALVHLARTLASNDFRLLDCQVYSRHLHSMGAVPMHRELFVSILDNYCGLDHPVQWPRRSESL